MENGPATTVLSASGRDTSTPEGAAAYEHDILVEAETIRGQAESLTPELFLRLYPLLCRPIPQAFIQHVGVTTGKPYESTGIRSVQVQIDRMNAVLTPLWWWDEAHYEEEGRLCRVTVYVGKRRFGTSPTHDILASTTSRGGVQRGSSTGNVYKGSYTNAAKLAFARLGVGHEVYIGMTDLDPDVSQEAAEAEPEPERKTIPRRLAKGLVDRAWDLGLKGSLQLAASHVAERDVGDCSTKQKATEALMTLSFAQAERLDAGLSRKADEQAAAGQGTL